MSGTGKLFLQSRHVKKTKIGCVKQCHAQRKPEAHEEVLDIICENQWHGLADGIHQLRKNPIHVQKPNRKKGQRQSANLQNGQISVIPAESHAGDERGRP